MKRPGVLLDRDGTIINDYHYVGLRERIQLIPGAAGAIARFNAAGIPVAIITNQSGVARGFYPERNVHIVHEYIMRELALHDAHINLFLYSPYHPESPIPDYRRFSQDHKPAPGMALRAAGALHLDLPNSIVVGDRIEDVDLARQIGAESIYLGHDPLPDYYSMTDIHPFDSLADAAGYIIERLTGVEQKSHFPTMQYGAISDYFVHYSDEVAQVLGEMNVDPRGLVQACTRLQQAFNGGDSIFVAGNGGSAAIADHMQVDLDKHMSGRRGEHTRVHSLCGNMALMTAISNDVGFDATFGFQLERQGDRGDVLVVYSVSGNSPNIVRAVQCANEMGMYTIAVVGKDGGKIAHMAGTVVHIPSFNYGVVEDVMSIVMHSLCQFIRQSRMTPEAILSAEF
jgi:histidinol-phosphate phosphatase family protein